MELLRSHLSRVRIPEPTNRIYKNECCVSFDTPKSDGGLYVDLSSFLAFGKEYVAWNYEKTGNPVYLHIQQRIKPVPEDRPLKKPTLLAIGVEGGFDNQEPEYEEIYHIVILPDGGDKKDKVVGMQIKEKEGGWGGKKKEEVGGGEKKTGIMLGSGGGEKEEGDGSEKKKEIMLGISSGGGEKKREVGGSQKKNEGWGDVKKKGKVVIDNGEGRWKNEEEHVVVAAPTEVEMNMMQYSGSDWYRVETVHAPQLFSDEKPNSCSSMGCLGSIVRVKLYTIYSDVNFTILWLINVLYFKF